MGIIRLTLFSTLAIGGAMLWFGRDEGLPEDRLGYVPAPPDVVAITPIPASAPVAVSPAAPGGSLPTPSAPTPSAELARMPAPANPSETNVTQEATPELPPAPAQPAPSAPAPPILYVTGTSVNLRAGTSTREAILARLPRGTPVAFLGDAAEGWSAIWVIESGTEGFMAARFLSPDQP